MNYKNIYDQLIQKRRIDRLNGNVHYHHIIPIACNGENTPRSKKYNIAGTNIVGLTIREHFVAHWLLTKIYKNTQYEEAMLYAFQCMKNFYPNLKISSHVYEKIMLKLKETMTKQRVGRVFVNNGKVNKYVFPENIPPGFSLGLIPSKKQLHVNKGRQYITNGKENRSIYIEIDEIPPGWKLGYTRSAKVREHCEKQKGTIYVTDGITNKRVNKNKIPAGFHVGRTLTTNQKAFKRTSLSGKRWITNGIDSKVIDANDELPVGYKYGRLQTQKMLDGYVKRDQTKQNKKMNL